MSRSKKVLTKDKLFKFPKYTGWYGEGIWRRETRKWFKRLANKAQRKFLNKEIING
jgi:hypothetical protein